MAWDVDTTELSMHLMREVANALLPPHSGYRVMSQCTESGVTAAFHSAQDAVRWALTTVQALLLAEW